MKGSKTTKTISPQMLGCYLGQVILYNGISCRLIAVSIDGWILVDYSLTGILDDEQISSRKTQSQVYEQDFTGKIEIELEEVGSDTMLGGEYTKIATAILDGAKLGLNVFGLTEHHGVIIKK